MDGLQDLDVEELGKARLKFVVSRAASGKYSSGVPYILIKNTHRAVYQRLLDLFSQKLAGNILHGKQFILHDLSCGFHA